ncbi:protein of unknown function [Filimonas lacunae]|uniref:DUF1842 domain-containing protein n=1 Tax=Filimonas lacunae TaxID=477680 RepID=A0A173MDP7_9BACT|nr:DUF1842 domain-containing protein [Filimonas lacunae]BAV05626.1 hypothetical protein FLA_1637 [Filimonas lacunae]SIT29142.1 protein of unknown function [Filimonas lacunae]
MSAPTNALADLYRACGIMGNQGTPGAPLVHYSLLVDPTNGKVTGIVHITQAIAGPNSDIRVNVTGTIQEFVFGAKVTKSIAISGDYLQYCTPPALCVYQLKFSANMLVENSWDGTGNFEYGCHVIKNVPVKSGNC